MTPSVQTHETFIHAVRDLVVPRLTSPADRQQLAQAKLVYGKGAAGLRGVTHFAAWQNGNPSPYDFVEVCALGEESPTQLAGTTIHELAHVLAGPGAGHDKAWKDACETLGLRKARAAGHRYSLAGFAPEIRPALAALAFRDGKPAFGGNGGAGVPMALFKLRPCSMGVGTRGGKSRGPGSGSRLRKWTCDCGVNARVASDDFQATCGRCGSAFKRG